MISIRLSGGIHVSVTDPVKSRGDWICLPGATESSSSTAYSISSSELAMKAWRFGVNLVRSILFCRSLLSKISVVVLLP